MARPVVFTFPALDVDSVCVLQTTAGAGSLIINGALTDVSSPPGTAPFIAVFPGIQRVVTLTVAVANLSGVNVTITGTDIFGVAVTETRVGPNNNTVATTAEFHTVSSVTVDGAVGTAMSVGTGTTGTMGFYVPNSWRTPFSVGIQAIATSTISYDVRYTLDDVNNDTTPNETVVGATFDDATTSIWGSLAVPCRAIRGIINSSSGSGALVLTFVQAGE